MAEDDMADEENVIVITGTSMEGSVETRVPPVDVLDATDVLSYGASSIDELVELLAPQTASARGRGDGRPVILLNGQRVSSFRALRDLPPEAIARVEIFPEEVARQYGYRPDQRVMNFILVKNFSSLSLEGSTGLSTQGGYGTAEAEGTYTKIGDSSRLVVNLEYEPNTALRESERNIIQSDDGFALGGNVVSSPQSAGNSDEIDPALSALAGFPVTIAGVPANLANNTQLADFLGAANVSDIGEYRTLIPSRDAFEGNIGYSRTISPGTILELNAAWRHEESKAQQGLNSAALTIPSTNPFSPFGNDVTLLGYYDASSPILRRINSDSFDLAGSLNGNLGAWRWIFSSSYNLSDTDTLTDDRADFSALEAGFASGDPTTAINPFSPDIANLTLGGLVPAGQVNFASNKSQSFDSNVVFSGELFYMPAGAVTASFSAGYNRFTLDSETIRSGTVTSSNLSRDVGLARASIDIPLLDHDPGFNIGQLSVNAAVGYSELSDFGGLFEYDYGFAWSPFDNLTLQASIIGEEAAPSVSQLGAPEIITPNVTVFDFTRNESVQVTTLSGGNPALGSEKRRDFKFSLNYEPHFLDGMRFILDYTRNRSSGTTQSFPALTAEIEAAFPDRFVRDADGRLVALDLRPVDYERIRTEQIRYGFNFSQRISGGQQQRGSGGGGRAAERGERRAGSSGGPPPGGPPPGDGAAGDANNPGSPPAEGQQRAGNDAPPPDRAARGSGRGSGGRGASPFGGRGGGRWNVSLFHTVKLNDTILIRPDLPELDLLNGSATGSNGGTARHSIELEGGIFYEGMGLRLSGNYNSGSRVDGSTSGNASELHFHDIATLNLRMFVNFDNRPGIIKALPFLENSRLRLSLNNIFDAQQRVTDEAGDVPLRYQPGYLDPQGRFFEISWRKRF